MDTSERSRQRSKKGGCCCCARHEEEEAMGNVRCLARAVSGAVFGPGCAGPSLLTTGLWNIYFAFRP
jgi:hypothetical protein